MVLGLAWDLTKEQLEELSEMRNEIRDHRLRLYFSWDMFGSKINIKSQRRQYHSSY